MPVCLRNLVLKELLSLKPTLSATCVTDVVGFAKRVIDFLHAAVTHILVRGPGLGDQRRDDGERDQSDHRQPEKCGRTVVPLGGVTDHSGAERSPCVYRKPDPY